MLIPQFWFYSAVFIAILVFLLGAELVRSRRVLITDFDRTRARFNAGILFILILATIYLTYMIEMHRKHLDVLIAPFPSARYAPERESLTSSERWVYVTHQQTDEIVAFYRQYSSGAGYTLVVDSGTTTSRLLFSRDGKQIFLTIENENDTRVLYYSEDGNARIVVR